MSIYLIPCPIADHQLDTIPPSTSNIIHQLEYFIVERAKSARRFIKESGHPKPIKDLNIFELNKHNPTEGLQEYLKKYSPGNDIGVISEAGCPGIADPGSSVVRWAHDNNIEVFPLVGPSSILLALMGSGFNGQQFLFHGYLPHDKGKLVKKLKWIELDVRKNGITHIFIETPYRNKSLLSTASSCLHPETQLSVAVDLSSENQEIITRKIKSWKGFEFNRLHKRPAIFSIGR